MRVIGEDLFGNAIVDIGGPDVISIGALLQRIRRARRGQNGRQLHVPVGPVRASLAMIEAVGAGRWLPLRAGQLASFRFPGTVSPNPLQDSLQATLRGVDDMLAQIESLNI